MQNKDKKIQYLINFLMVFIVLQPVFDVFSNLANNNLIKINLITYIKPFIVFAIYLFLFFFYKYKGKWPQFFFYILIFCYLIGHSIMLYSIFVDLEVIIHEIRFIINIIYFITIFLTLYNISNIIEDKEKFYKQLRFSLIVSVCLYVSLYLIAVLTKTSWLTYEFADAQKLGYRGWNFSGQILGHLLSISLPIFMYAISKAKISNILKILIIALTCIPFLLLGTKVPYFILLIVTILFLVINVGYKMIHHDYKIDKLICIMSILIFITSIGIYKKLPVSHNIMLNNSILQTQTKKEDIDKYTAEMREKAQKNKEQIEKNKHSSDPIIKVENKLSFIISDEQREQLALKYEDWTLESLRELNKLYESDSLHSADTRNKQMYFLHFKFIKAYFPFKLLGLGYLNQPNGLSIERDIIMPFYAFGIIGFLLLTGILWCLFFKMLYICIKNIKKLDIETIILCESFCMFFFISFYAGYTYIYTQFSIILAINMCLLNISLNKLENKNLEQAKKEKGQ